MKKTIRFAYAIFSFSLLNAAFAASPGVYSGFGIGPGLVKPSSQQLLKKTDTSGFNGRAFGGYNFNQHFGIETGYARYSHSSLYKSDMANTGYALNAIDLVGKGYLSFNQGDLNVYLLGGMAYAQDTVTYENAMASINDANNVSRTYNQLRPVYGVGADFDLLSGSKLSTNLEMTRIQGAGGDVKTNPNALPSSNLLTWDISYHFD